MKEIRTCIKCKVAYEDEQCRHEVKELAIMQEEFDIWLPVLENMDICSYCLRDVLKYILGKDYEEFIEENKDYFMSLFNKKCSGLYENN